MSFLAKAKYVSVLAITITAVVVFAFVLVNATTQTPSEDLETSPPVSVAENNVQVAEAGITHAPVVIKPTVAPTPVPSNYPSLLVIPKISVRSHVQYVGETAKGTLASPTNFTDVAWYKFGTVPGVNGTAVIDGHLDNGLGLQAVFKHLSDLAPGDEIEVITKGGDTLHFVVDQTISYDYNDPAVAPALFSQTETPTLRLVTCDGDWVQSGKTYNRRLIVSAKLVL